jgi:hypothetical protein
MACNSNVDTIEEYCGGPNAPQLKRALFITTLAKVSSIPAAAEHLVSGDIEMVATMLFYKWNFSKEESSFESVQDENGMWNTTVKIFIEKMEAAESNVLNGMNGDNYLGELDNGCTVRVKEQTNPKNGYEVTITWQSAHSPYFYTGDITT